MGISLSGLSSGLDTDTIITQLVSAYSTKKDDLVKAQTKLSWKQDAWKSLNSKIYSFYSGSLSSLRFSSGYSIKKATSTSAKATVKAGTNAVDGTQKLKVKSLAKSGYLTGAVVDKVSDGKGGQTKVTGSTKLTDMGVTSGSSVSVAANGKETNIAITDDMTVNQLVTKIKEAGVNASFDENNQRFFVSSKKSGADSDFSLTSDNADGMTALSKLGLVSYSDKDISTYRSLADMDSDAKAESIYENRKTAHTDAEKEKKSLENQVRTLKTTVAKQEKSTALAEAKSAYAAEYYNKTFEERSAAEEEAKNAVEELKGKKDLTDDEKTQLEELETKYAAIKSANADLQNDTLVDEDRQKIADTYASDAVEASKELAKNKTQLEKFEDILADESGAKLDEYVADRNNTIDEENANLKANLKTYYAAQKEQAQKMVGYYDTYNNYSSISSPTAEETAAYNEAVAALGITTGSKAATRIAGQDSEIELNGATFTSNTNNYSINGLTIEVNALTDDDEEISITTATDVDGLYDKVKEFISTYNSLINEMDTLYNASSSKGYEPLTDDEKSQMTDDEIEKWEKKIKDSLLRRDSTLESVSNVLKNSFMKSYDVDGKKYSLSSFGIKTGGYFTTSDNSKSALHIDGDEDDELTSGNTDKLRAAIASDPETFISFFTQLSKGIYNELDKKMKGTTLSSAYTVYNDKSMQTEYRNYTKKISEWEDRISNYEQKYRKQFTAMETALSKLNSNSSYITNMLG